VNHKHLQPSNGGIVWHISPADPDFSGHAKELKDFKESPKVRNISFSEAVTQYAFDLRKFNSTQTSSSINDIASMRPSEKLEYFFKLLPQNKEENYKGKFGAVTFNEREDGVDVLNISESLKEATKQATSEMSKRLKQTKIFIGCFGMDHTHNVDICQLHHGLPPGSTIPGENRPFTRVKSH